MPNPTTEKPRRAPGALTLWLGRFTGGLWYAFYVPHRRLTCKNIRFCYPEWSRGRVRKVSKGVFKNAGTTLVELFRMPFMTREDLLDAVRVRGGEHLDKALQGDRGLIIITAHTGNWELAAQFLHCYTGKPFALVIRRVKNKLADRFLRRVRTRHGVDVIRKRGAWPKMVEAVRAGKMLAITIDQSKTRGVDVRFLGRQASVGVGPALLALRTRAPVLPVFTIREPDGAHSLWVMPLLELRRTGDLSSDLEYNTQLMADTMEAVIREYPEQWIWFQRPWRKAHPELYPEWVAQRERTSKRRQRRNRAYA